MTNNVNPDLDDFFITIRKDVEKKINDTVIDENIKDILQGGKRLRPLLSNLAFKACTEGKEEDATYQRAIEGSVSIELAHAASLVHDDIIDKDSERRGKTAFHIKEGIGKALLTGHKMLVHGLEIAMNHSREIAKLYIDSWNEVLNGEIDEVDFNKDGEKFEYSSKNAFFEAYYRIIDLKTAALFSSACQAGALEANMSGDILKVFRDYGRHIGLAYQLADDLVDLENGEMLDSVVVPILNRIEHNNKITTGLKKREIKKLLDKNEDKIKKFYIDEIKKHVEKARKMSLSDMIPQSHYKNLLSEAPSFIINAMLKEVNITI